MEPVTQDSPFEDLPEALVDEMLSYHQTLSTRLSGGFEKIQDSRKTIRETLAGMNFLNDDSKIISTHVNPTTCGVDGAYAIERLLSTDIAATAAVAVEGLTPPTEKRFWPSPRHLAHLCAINHNDSTFLAIRAIMITMELELISNAPHDVVFLDGSLTTPMIHFNQAFSMINEVDPELSRNLLGRIENALNCYKNILSGARSDKVFVGVPKYTSRNEIASKIGMVQYEDRSMLSFVLDGGEIAGPCPMLQPNDYWHFVGLPDSVMEVSKEIVSLIKELSVLYYRPYQFFPALRLEIPPAIARNSARLSILLEALQLQCGSPSIMEPYPLYLADRMVKHLGTAIPAIRKATTQQMANDFSDEIGSIFLAMHGYRTEYGR